MTAWGARAADDLSELPGAPLVEVRHAGDHGSLQRRGLEVTARATARCRTGVVVLPRARALGRDRIARAAALTDGLLIVDGQKTDGIESTLRDLRARAEIVDVIVRAHGKSVVLRGGIFDDWRRAPGRDPDGWLKAPGVFSADGVDPGSALLADSLPTDMAGRVVDLGAGWGYLAARVLQRTGVLTCDLVEADLDALDCARVNVPDPRAAFHWADALGPLSGLSPADHVVTNPPFHAERRADPSLGAAFIAAAADLLAPSGTLWLVANRHLPYEAPLALQFGQIEALAGNAAFKVLRATRPHKARRATGRADPRASQKEGRRR